MNGFAKTFRWLPVSNNVQTKISRVLDILCNVFLYLQHCDLLERCPKSYAPPGGNTGNVPPLPRNWKNYCRKMMLFPKALFLAATFPIIDKNSIFLMRFYQQISKFSQNFSSICIFRPNARKTDAGFLKFCRE